MNVDLMVRRYETMISDANVRGRGMPKVETEPLAMDTRHQVIPQCVRPLLATETVNTGEDLKEAYNFLEMMAARQGMDAPREPMQDGKFGKRWQKTDAGAAEYVAPVGFPILSFRDRDSELPRPQKTYSENYTPSVSSPHKSDRIIRGPPQEFIDRVVEMNPIIAECRVEARIIEAREEFLQQRVQFVEHLLHQILKQTETEVESEVEPQEHNENPQSGRPFLDTFACDGTEFRNVFSEMAHARSRAPLQSWITGA